MMPAPGRFVALMLMTAGGCSDCGHPPVRVISPATAPGSPSVDSSALTASRDVFGEHYRRAHAQPSHDPRPIGDPDPSRRPPLSLPFRPGPAHRRPIRRQIAVTHTSTCVLFEDGQVLCWGANPRYLIWHGESPGVALVPLGSAATQLAIEGGDPAIVSPPSCALLESGRVRCWNGYETLGLYSLETWQKHLLQDNQRGIFLDADVDLPPLSSLLPGRFLAGPGADGEIVTRPSLRRPAHLALPLAVALPLAQPRLRGPMAMPEADHYELDEQEVAALARLDQRWPVQQVVSVGSGGCALSRAGKVRCWGWQASGESSSSRQAPRPTTLAGLEAGKDLALGGPVAQLVAGWSHVCARRPDGVVRCWGENEVGQLGYGHTRPVRLSDLEAPGDVPLGGKAVQLSAARYVTCALLDTGRARCWGRGRGNLGHEFDARGEPRTAVELPYKLGIGDDETPASLGDIPLFE